MRNRDYFKGKKITVVGLARSGISCAGLLVRLGAAVGVTDSRDDAATRSAARQLRPAGVKIELGRHTRRFLCGSDMLVVSPGVPATALPLKWAREAGIPVIGEIEVGWILCPARVIAVTGSNGKTTVTTLIGMILKKAGRKAVVCGNIGTPFTAVVPKLGPGDFVCLEVSSFQLETIRDFRPHVALILNFSRNHLDRYPGMRQYLAAKARIFLNQGKADYLLVNRNDRVLRRLARRASSRKVYFSASRQFNANQAAALAAVSVLGVGPKAACEVFRKFKGIEHRMEEAGNVRGIRFINDSKSTTVDATVWALRNIVPPAVLIAGGREKGNDYRPVRRLLAVAGIKSAVLIGEAKDRIAGAFEGAVPCRQAESLEEAVRLAFKMARRGENILFSPMCKSFDMFADYEDRGRRFKAAVRGLKAGGGSI